MTTLPPLVLEWSRGLASLSPGVVPCRGMSPEAWRQCYDLLGKFVDAHGVTAAETGWDTLRLFAVSPTLGTIQREWCGVLMPLTVEVREVTADYIKLGRWTAYRRVPVKRVGVAVWDVPRPTSSP